MRWQPLKNRLSLIQTVTLAIGTSEEFTLGRIRDRDVQLIPLKKVIALNPDYYVAYTDLVTVYDNLGMKKEMNELLDITIEELYPRYLSKHPDDARAQLNFAFTSFKREGFNKQKLRQPKLMS